MTPPRIRSSKNALLWLIAALAGAWYIATLTYVLIRSSVEGLTFAGPSSALFPVDQLHYLAWIREAGQHGLIANPYRPGAPRVFLHPLFLISGLLWRAGMSIQAAYLVWTPIAALAIVWGYARFIGRFLQGRERAAGLALSLLYLSPLVPLFDYGRIVNADGANDLVVAAGHGATYWQAWGYLPTLIGLGMMAVCLTGADAISMKERDGWRSAGVGAAAGLASWLYPWGGLELVVILGGTLLLNRRPAGRAGIAIPLVAACLPLVYYAVLARIDSAWSLSLLRSGTTGPAWPLLVGYLPLIVVGLPALRQQWTAGKHLIGLWLLSAIVVYLLLPNSRYAALESVSLPFAVLAIRGWRELHVSPAISAVALFLAIVPGAFYSAHTFRDILHDREVPFALAPGERRALEVLEHSPGTVLATPYLAPALPALISGLAGRVENGSDALFAGTESATRAAASARGVRAVVSDCLPGRADLSSVLAPLGFRERRFGCERLYERG